MPAFDDKELICKDCGKTFVWTSGEQQFFAQKGFQNAPTRCPEDRRANKQRVAGARQTYTIVCSDCGKEGEVPFQPRDPSAPVYCADCFRVRRGLNNEPAADKSADTQDEQAA